MPENNLITIEWLLSIGAEVAGWSDISCQKVDRVHFNGADWRFGFVTGETPYLSVGSEYPESDKEIPHFTTKDQFRALYELLENKKLVE